MPLSNQINYIIDSKANLLKYFIINIITIMSFLDWERST